MNGKKLLSVALSTLLTLSLAARGGNGGSSGPVSASGSNPGSDTAPGSRGNAAVAAVVNGI